MFLFDTLYFLHAAFVYFWQPNASLSNRTVHYCWNKQKQCNLYISISCLPLSVKLLPVFNQMWTNIFFLGTVKKPTTGNTGAERAALSSFSPTLLDSRRLNLCLRYLQFTFECVLNIPMERVTPTVNVLTAERPRGAQILWFYSREGSPFMRGFTYRRAFWLKQAEFRESAASPAERAENQQRRMPLALQTHSVRLMNPDGSKLGLCLVEKVFQICDFIQSNFKSQTKHLVIWNMETNIPIKSPTGQKCCI